MILVNKIRICFFEANITFILFTNIKHQYTSLSTVIVTEETWIILLGNILRNFKIFQIR